MNPSDPYIHMIYEEHWYGADHWRQRMCFALNEI